MALLKENVIPTVKYGGGGVMVWGCIGNNAVGKIHFIEGIMNAKMYLKILQDKLFESAKIVGLGDNFYFQQDNDPKHTAQIVQNWLRDYSSSSAENSIPVARFKSLRKTVVIS
ncbi:unnamed protein product [Euphydryas editha]|uniref:Transposase n=1 Tax=Euphydryas editha TaxID=104508 RepID=A0AAU9V265_EUPED|nr:unnamed protein product [Euphydryas editha]